jgi:hypothetical protein
MYSATSTKRTDHYFTGPQATGSYVAMTVGDMVDGNWYDVEIQFNKTSGQCRYLMNGTTTSGYESTDSGWVAPLTPTTPLNVPENVTFSVPYNRPGTRMNYDDIRIYSGFSEPSAGETCTLYIDGASQNVSTGISDGQWSARASQYLIDNNYDNSTHNWSVTCGSLNSTQLAFTVKDPAYTYKTDFCRVMDASGTYELTQNVARSGTDCISVTAVNVSIDCRAYTINATNANGITYNTGTSESFNEYVRNCTIAGDNAIHFPFSATGKHSGWTLSDSSLYGVYHAVEFGMGYQSQDYSIERNYLSTSTNFATTSALFFNNGGQINAYMYNNTFASRTAIYHNGAGETYPMFVNNTVLNRSNAVQVTFGTAMRWTSGGRLYNNILWVPLTTQVQALNHTASTTKTFLNGQKNIVGGCYYGGNAYAYDNTTNSCTDADYDGFCDSGRMTEYLWDAYPLKNGTYDCSELVLIAPGNNTVNTSVEMNFTFRKNSLTNQTCSVYVDGVSRNSTITGASDGLFKLQTTQFWIDHNLDDHNLNTSAPYADIYYGHNWSVNCTSVNSSTYKVSMKDAVYPYIVNRIPRYFRYSGYYRVTANLSGGGSSAFNFDNIMNSPSRHNFEVDCAGYSFSNTTGMLYSNQVNNVTIRNCVDTDATYYGPSSYYYSVYTNYGGPYYLYNNTIYGGYGYPNWFRGGVATLVNNTFLDGGCLGSCFTNGFADGAYPLVEGNSFSRGGFSGTAYFYGWVRNNTFGVNASLGSCPDLKFDGNITGNRFYGYVDAALWSSNAKVYDNLFNRSFTTCSAFNNASMNTTLITGTNIIGGSYVGGNYYANETGGGYSQMCMDYLRDGICDASYVLTNNFTDYLPLTYPRTCYGNQSSLVAPANGSTYITSGNVTFQATVGTYDIVWIYDNGNLVASMNVSGNVSYFPVTGGQHNVTFVQTDVSGCAGNTTTETTYSWIPTSVTLLSPADDSIVTSQYENFTFNVYFAMSETCNLTIDGVVRSSMAVNADGNYSMQAASYLASINYDGNDHNWSVQCTHASTGDYNFTVQYESLNVTSVSCPALTYPNEGDLPAPAYIPVNFSVYDASGFTAPVIDVELTDGTYSSHNENCTYTQSDSQHRQYTCSVKVRYWYAPGDYDVSVSYTDDGNNATGYQSNLCGLGAIIAYVQNYGSVQFPGASPGTSNVEGTPAITVNNTGNTQMDLFMTAYDLDGRTAPLQKLSASAFKAGGSLGSAVTLTNGVQKNLSISLVSGNTSYAEVKLWLSIPSGQTIQEYYSATPWQLVGQNS